jgi:two-component system cell cycle sensor histidine kinase/response regulator CckA
MRPFTPTSTILLVDDHPAILRTTRRMLERIGHAVIEADCGQTALDHLKTHPDIDLVILDLGLPDMPGDAVLATLRHRRPDVRVIVSSGAHPGATGDPVAGIEPDAYLDKPYSLAQLRETLDRLR